MYTTDQAVDRFLAEFLSRDYVRAGRYCLVNVQGVGDEEAFLAISKAVDDL